MTCRRRHVKCDHARPTCATCHKAGLDCGGYLSQIRWASDSYRPSRPAGTSKRSRPLSQLDQGARIEHVTFEDRHVDQGTEDTENHGAESLSEKTQLSSIAETVPLIDSYNYVQHDNSSNMMVEDMPFDASSLSDNRNSMSADATGPDDPTLRPQQQDLFNPSPVGSMLDLESLFEPSNGLIWNDLFDTTFDMPMPLAHDQLQDRPHSEPLSLFVHIAQQPHDYIRAEQPLEFSVTPSQKYSKQHINPQNLLFDSQTPPSALAELDEVQVLQNSQYLLRHFRDNVIPQFGPLPMNCRSPWETLNWSSAIQTHAELTWLQGSNVKHATQANLFALLGCSAHMVAKVSPSSSELDSVRAMQTLEYASKRAKRHMQESLRLEAAGEGKSRYKDQLMAMFSLIALAVSRSECRVNLKLILAATDRNR